MVEEKQEGVYFASPPPPPGKIGLNLCSRRSLKWTHKLVSSRIPSISWMPNYVSLNCLTRCTSSHLNTDFVGEFLRVSSNRFHFIIQF